MGRKSSKKQNAFSLKRLFTKLIFPNGIWELMIDSYIRLKNIKDYDFKTI